MKTFQTIYLEYYTADLEPPFAYQLQTKLSNGKDGLNVDLTLEYYDREDFTQEELLEEGAEPIQKFEWKGTLGKIWISALEDVLPKLKLSAEEDDKVFFLKIDSEGNTAEGFLENTVVFETLFQELQQAIFEAAEKEYPLSIQILKKDKDQSLSYTLIGSFAERKSLIVKSAGGTETQKEINWNEMRKVMELFYSLDFDPEKALETEPEKKGIYLEPGDGNWYMMQEDNDLQKLLKMIE